MKRGELWWAELAPTQGSEIRKRRPVLILSVDPVNLARRTVVAVPLSTGPKPRPPIVVSTPSAGDGAVAVCDQLRALDKSRFGQQLGALDDTDLVAVEAAVRKLLGL